jgi:hypothetical protein
MQVSHTPAAVSASFDDPNLVSTAGLVPVMRLAQNAGLTGLAQQWLSVPTDKGANAGLKVSSLVAGMVAGVDSIDDMAVLRHGAMGKLFAGIYAPSTPSWPLAVASMDPDLGVTACLEPDFAALTPPRVFKTPASYAIPAPRWLPSRTSAPMSPSPRSRARPGFSRHSPPRQPKWAGRSLPRP